MLLWIGALDKNKYQRKKEEEKFFIFVYSDTQFNLVRLILCI